MCKIPVISLFCGCGGMDLGFEQSNFKTILAIDNDPTAVATFNHNRKEPVARIGNLLSVTGKDIIEMIRQMPVLSIPRGIIGGPPCQSFSQGNTYQSKNDPRHEIPFRYAEILNTLNLEYGLDFFVFENVVGMRSGKHMPIYDDLIEKLTTAGFDVISSELNAVDFGVPQNRRRMIIVGINHRLGLASKVAFQKVARTGDHTVRDVIHGLPEPAIFTRHLDQACIPHHPNHWTMKPKSAKFANPNQFIGRGKSFRCLLWDQPSPTVAYGHNEIHVHPDGRRRLSIFEAMKLQGFPDSYHLLGTLTSQVRQVSNAVPPPLARAVADSIWHAVYA